VSGKGMALAFGLLGVGVFVAASSGGGGDVAGVFGLQFRDFDVVDEGGAFVPVLLFNLCKYNHYWLRCFPI